MDRKRAIIPVVLGGRILDDDRSWSIVVVRYQGIQPGQETTLPEFVIVL